MLVINRDDMHKQDEVPVLTSDSANFDSEQAITAPASSVPSSSHVALTNYNDTASTTTITYTKKAAFGHAFYTGLCTVYSTVRFNHSTLLGR